MTQEGETSPLMALCAKAVSDQRGQHDETTHLRFLGQFTGTLEHQRRFQYQDVFEDETRFPLPYFFPIRRDVRFCTKTVIDFMVL